MPTFTVTYTTEAERRAYEQAIAFVAEMHALGRSAPTAPCSTPARPSRFPKAVIFSGRPSQGRLRPGSTSSKKSED